MTTRPATLRRAARVRLVNPIEDVNASSTCRSMTARVASIRAARRDERSDVCLRRAADEEPGVIAAYRQRPKGFGLCQVATGVGVVVGAGLGEPTLVSGHLQGAHSSCPRSLPRIDKGGCGHSWIQAHPVFLLN